MTIDIPDSLGRLMYDDNVTEYTKILLDIFAEKAHTHSQSDITGLETTLAGFLQESDLDNVPKIHPGNWGYTEEKGGSNPTYYDYTFDQIPVNSIKIFSGNLKLSFHSYFTSGKGDRIILPSGGIYFYAFGCSTSDSSTSTYFNLRSVAVQGGGLSIFEASDSGPFYLKLLFAIRLS